MTTPTVRLKHACDRGDVGLARRWIAEGAALDKIHGDATLLGRACDNGRLDEIARLLVESGADPNKSARQKHAPLYFSCVRGRHDIARLLLDHGASIDGATHYSGATALYGAVEVAGTALLSADTRRDCARLLLARGASVHKPNAFGTTPLHLACYYGDVAMTRDLLRAGADPLRRNEDGDTPQMRAEFAPSATWAPLNKLLDGFLLAHYAIRVRLCVVGPRTAAVSARHRVNADLARYVARFLAGDGTREAPADSSSEDDDSEQSWE